MTMQTQTGRPKIGEGRISGAIAASLGPLCVGAVLCLRFPDLLTTAEFRPLYNVGLMRLILALAMCTAVMAGMLSFVLARPKYLGAIGLSCVLLAMLLGGPYVTAETVHTHLYFGLDWLVLDLFFGGSAFIALEWVLPRVIVDQGVFREDWQLDLTYFSINHLLIGLFLLISNHFAHDLFGWAQNFWLKVHIAALPPVLRFLLIVLAADFVEYVSHRCYHEVPFLWRIHAVHHSPHHMDWLSGSRLHILEVIMTRSLVLVPVFLLGFPEETIFAYVIFVSIQSVVIHSNIAMDVGWLRYFIVTPQFHHWHHASDEEALDRNYCAHTPLFDLVFRTYHQPADRWPQHYGTVKPIPGGFFGQLLYPFSGHVEKETFGGSGD